MKKAIYIVVALLAIGVIVVGVVFDRFGTDIHIVKKDAGHFICHVKVAVSPHFLS